MAPDINSLPPSPYRPVSGSVSSNPRSSSELRTYTTSSFSFPQPHSPIQGFRDQMPLSASSSGPGPDNAGVGAGPGPLRHPRPLTAADLHMQLEKEQEAVVNRLTRELSLLRQQSASVASTASSASNSMPDFSDNVSNPPTTNADPPNTSRRHRSSSSLSMRSTNPALAGHGGGASGPNTMSSAAASFAGISASGIAPPRDTTAPYTYPRDPLSRQSSVASRRSDASSPSLSSSLVQADPFTGLYTRRYSGSTSQAQQGTAAQNSSSVFSGRPSHIPSTQRHEEANLARSELESVRKENEELKSRIRDLERIMRQRQSESEISRRSSLQADTSTAAVPQHSRNDGRGDGTDTPVDKEAGTGERVNR